MIAISTLGRQWMSGKSADAWDYVTELETDNGVFEFDTPVAIDGDTILVGQPQDNRVFVFSRNEGGENNWGQVTTLSNPGGFFLDAFGGALAVAGDTIVVSAPGGDIINYVGHVYVFARNQGGENNWDLLRP